MKKKLSKLQLAQNQAEEAIKATNGKIEELGQYTNDLYISLNEINRLFDAIRNVPQESQLKYEELKKVRLNWKQQAENIQLEYKRAEVKTAGQGAAGVGAGVAVAALGPTAAMGIATTFGVASTGTAISALSGAAATNAALAWLGGGALAAGGGGMAAGNAFLAMAGPVGWTIAGVSLLASGLLFFKTKNDKEKLENIFTLISKRDVKSYELAIVELSERINRIENETIELNKGIDRIKTFGIDYHSMSENQQLELGAFVNLMEASTMLLVNPIMGLNPKYSENDFEELCKVVKSDSYRLQLTNYKNLIISLSNLLYEIDLDEKDRKLLFKTFKNNKELLESIGVNKKEFSLDHFYMIELALNNAYKAKEIEHE